MSFLCANSGDASTPAPTTDTLTQAHLARAEAIRKELVALSNELSKVAPNNEAVFAVNRACLSMDGVVKFIGESLSL